jgi:hypothetical protein
MRIKSNKWVDGRQLDTWPVAEHIGWSVVTAGTIDLDLEDRTPSYNSGRTRILPKGFPMVLKDIRDGMAYGYNEHEGVIRVPAELLQPWSK